MDDLRFPIGKFSFSGTQSHDERAALIDQIAATPESMRAAVRGLSDEQLDTSYRPGGWTVRQVVHHVPESHMHSYIRFKLAITEDEPTINHTSKIVGRNCRTRWLRLNLHSIYLKHCTVAGFGFCAHSKMRISIVRLIIPSWARLVSRRM